MIAEFVIAGSILSSIGKISAVNSVDFAVTEYALHNGYMNEANPALRGPFAARLAIRMAGNSAIGYAHSRIKDKNRRRLLIGGWVAVNALVTKHNLDLIRGAK